MVKTSTRTSLWYIFIFRFICKSQCSSALIFWPQTLLNSPHSEPSCNLYNDFGYAWHCNFFSMPWHLSNGHSSIIEYISPLLKYGPVAFIGKTWSLSFLFFHFFNMVKIELLINSYSFQTVSRFQKRNCVQLPRKRAPFVGEIETKQEGEEGAKMALTKAILSWIISLLMKSY